MKLLDKLKGHSPKEVYASVTMLYFLLFLNASELLSSRIRISDIFELRYSVAYGLIQGIGDDNLRYDAALILYWVLAVVFVSISLIKAKKISAWLWDND